MLSLTSRLCNGDSDSSACEPCNKTGIQENFDTIANDHFRYMLPQPKWRSTSNRVAILCVVRCIIFFTLRRGNLPTPRSINATDCSKPAMNSSQLVVSGQVSAAKYGHKRLIVVCLTMLTDRSLHLKSFTYYYFVLVG